ncbi:helix-turn-helix transcriptional regulator [Fructilactobacillus cliffordii]|uniref:helix-turn-helix transcriptional regulator n=1 Tax=Fructilactobacillus cliffordii TaxID=2940299 RepID=UPI002092EF77|nr:helix-turn-helix transcriptional regulator [Fructilactobacillus cliffordii]USS86454.1 helix-turn-helix transcriptional regulator [Fructilactobacillus cliffordii]
MKTFIKDENEFSKTVIRNGMNYALLAKKVGITRPYLSNIVHGSSVGSVTAGKIAKALNAHFEDIFFTQSVDKNCTKNEIKKVM